jgi:hypothetical membrane protein
MLGAVAGILSPVIAFACILLAIASHHSFSWTNNALSDLGVIKGFTGVLFNFGLIIGGFLGLVFAKLGLYDHIAKNFVGKTGALVFAATTLVLVFIGIFNENFGVIHYEFSVAFFVLAPISVFILTCAFGLAHQLRMVVLTLATGVVAALPWLLQFAFSYVPNVAVPETISGLAISAWTIALSYEIMKQAKN